MQINSSCRKQSSPEDVHDRSQRSMMGGAQYTRYFHGVQKQTSIVQHKKLCIKHLQIDFKIQQKAQSQCDIFRQTRRDVWSNIQHKILTKISNVDKIEGFRLRTSRLNIDKKTIIIGPIRIFGLSRFRWLKKPSIFNSKNLAQIESWQWESWWKVSNQ